MLNRRNHCTALRAWCVSHAHSIAQPQGNWPLLARSVSYVSPLLLSICPQLIALRKTSDTAQPALNLAVQFCSALSHKRLRSQRYVICSI